jgi:hypothetical protein
VSGQAEILYYKIGISHVFARAHSIKDLEQRLVESPDNVSEWSIMSICGRLFQSARTKTG